MANTPTAPDISALDNDSMLYRLYMALSECMNKAGSFSPPAIDPDDSSLQNEDGELDAAKVQQVLQEYSSLAMQNVAFGMAEAIVSILGNQEHIGAVLPFDGFIDSVGISDILNPNPGGKIYFVRSAKQFAYYREEDVKYCSMWKGYIHYATRGNKTVIPNSNVLFVYQNVLHLWNGEDLIPVSFGHIGTENQNVTL